MASGRLVILLGLLAGALIFKGIHAIAHARNGLRRNAPPKRARQARPPEARVVVRKR